MPISFRRPGLIRGLALLVALTRGQPDARPREAVPPSPSEFSSRDVASNDEAIAPRGIASPGKGYRSVLHWGGTNDETEPMVDALRPVLFETPAPVPTPAPIPPPLRLPPLEPVPATDDPPPEAEPSSLEPAINGPVYEIGPPVEFAPTSRPVAAPMFGEIVSASRGSAGGRGDCRECGPLARLLGNCDSCDPCGPWGRLFYLGAHEQSCGPGIGQDRVMLAPFFIEATQPFSNYRLRIDDVAGLTFPDRAEFFWAAPPKGPKTPEGRIDYQELRLQIEQGSENFSLATDLPLRLVDPQFNDNTAGFSDMTVTQKAVLVDGDYWQVSQYFRTYINTGSARKGLGTGHLSLEPGVLGRYQWTERTYLHGELLYWFPLDANKTYVGQRLKYGLGVSTVLYETDMFAVMPTLEWVSWYFFDGAKTLPDGTVSNVDGINFVNIHPGVRFTLGPRDDLGLFEVGIAGGLGIGGERLYDSILRIDLRWSYY